MRPTLFRKTLLAMAITAATLPAYAADIQINADTATDITTVSSAEVTKITGDFAANTGVIHALTLDQAGAGDLELAATIVLSGTDAVTGFNMGGSSDAGLSNAAGNDLVNGNLTHSGNISVTSANTGAAAIRLIRAAIEGSLSNTGDLAFTGASGHGISLTTHSTVGASLSNALGATITATGADTKGISLAGAKIGKDLFNAGTLTVNGQGAMAIALTDKAQIAGDLVNGASGVITAEGGKAIGISLVDATVQGSLINSGSLSTDGITSTGIELGGLSVVTKDLLNTAGAKIKVDKENSIGISLLADAKVEGSLINRGNVATNGINTQAIKLATDASIGESLTNEGIINVTGDGSRGIALAGTVGESLINTGVMEITGDNARAIDLATGGIITQDLHNQAGGRIIVKGPEAIGISLAGTAGNVINEGLLNIDGANAKGIVLSAGTITSLHAGDGSITAFGKNAMGISLEGGAITDSLTNAGGLGATGESARGINLAAGSEIGKELLNTGNINVSGLNANGILLNQATIAEKLFNQGWIKAEGEGASAIKLQNAGAPSTTTSTLASLENTKSLWAVGEGSFGLNVDGAHFTQTAGAHILNSGDIEADGTAIRIGGLVSTSGTSLDIHNSGSLIGAVAAVDASAATTTPATNAVSTVNLTLDNGSKVQGDLLGLSALNVKGDVQFTGKTHVTMAKDGAINLGDGTDAGRLSLGQAHSTFTGNLHVNKDSSLILNISDDTTAGKAILAVNGTATFDTSSKLLVNATGRDFAEKGNTYTLLASTGQLSATAANVDVQSSSALLDITNVVDTAANTITSQVAVKGGAEIADLVGKLGASSSSQAALTTLTGDRILAKLQAGDAVLAAFASADAAQLAVLAKQLTPEVGGGAAQAATGGQTLVANMTSGRTSAVRGMASGDASKQTGIWAQGLYSDATQGMRNGIDGYNAKSNGMAFGADAKINDQLTLGLAYSHLNTDVNSQSGNKTKVDGHAFTLYGGYELGNVFVDGALTYGLNDNESKRTIAGTQAKANYNSDLLGLNLTAGYTYRFSPQLLAEPQLAARYSQVNIDNYREKGSSAALAVEKQRHEAIELGAGVRLAGHFPLGKGTLEPSAKVMAFHDFAASETSSTSTFVLGSTPFVTSGPNAARNSYEVGVGADYKLGAVTLGLNYDYVGKTGFDADTVTAKVRYDF